MPKIKIASNETHLPAVHLEQRYGVCGMTINRWLKNRTLNFPQPIRINNRRYWAQSDLLAFEKRQAALSARARQPDQVERSRTDTSIVSDGIAHCRHPYGRRAADA